jgi:hypothetical protein
MLVAVIQRFNHEIVRRFNHELLKPEGHAATTAGPCRQARLVSVSHSVTLPWRALGIGVRSAAEAAEHPFNHMFPASQARVNGQIAPRC